MANPPEETTTKNWRWFKSYQYNKQKDSASDARNVLLIVAALITAITFQAGVTPPGGMWQENENGHTAGRAIYATHQEAFYVFLISNTLALYTAVFVIVSLTYSFPFRCEIWIATISMLMTYGSAVFAVTPDESVKFRYILFAAAVPFMLRLLWEIFSRCRVRLPFNFHACCYSEFRELVMFAFDQLIICQLLCDSGLDYIERKLRY